MEISIIMIIGFWGMLFFITEEIEKYFKRN